MRILDLYFSSSLPRSNWGGATNVNMLAPGYTKLFLRIYDESFKIILVITDNNKKLVISSSWSNFK